ncbi:hypothetical protein QBC45DRAFT_422668 [Copromyces sp. CBS 386.78]|nr:hypothetical protein QBC45DRAFT_422668 [Copromyces sp. CBS 386.78]
MTSSCPLSSTTASALASLYDVFVPVSFSPCRPDNVTRERGGYQVTYDAVVPNVVSSCSLTSVGHHRVASRSRIWVGRLRPLKKRERAPLRMQNLGKVRCYASRHRLNIKRTLTALDQNTLSEAEMQLELEQKIRHEAEFILLKGATVCISPRCGLKSFMVWPTSAHHTSVTFHGSQNPSSVSLSKFQNIKKIKKSEYGFSITTDR